MRIDTLIEYKKYLAAGFTEQQATLQAESLALAAELDKEIVLRPEMQLMQDKMMAQINARFMVVIIIGGAIFTTTIIPTIQHYIDARRYDKLIQTLEANVDSLKNKQTEGY
jgi:hypothetical protein